MAQHAYLFEAKGIQRYIFDTGRLIDLIGSSDLVAGLCGDPATDQVGRVLAAAGLADRVTFSRRASAAFCALSDDLDALIRLRALWRLAVGIACPGLEFVDCDPRQVVGASEEAAMAQARRAAGRLRENGAAWLLPVGGPMTAFARRTGRVGSPSDGDRRAERVGSLIDGDTRDGATPDVLDAVAAAQRARGHRISDAAGLDTLAEKFLAPGASRPDIRFPRHFEAGEATPTNPAFPFLGHDERVAVIHADISGLGDFYRRVSTTEAGAARKLAISQAIEAAVIAAARTAAAAHLLGHRLEPGEADYDKLTGWQRAAQPKPAYAIAPARPVVLGGDDLTVIVRADLAFAFTEALLVGIERETAAAFATLFAGRADLPARLSACAGVAVVAAGHPFLAAANLAEGLCGFAKKTAKAGGVPPWPSCVQFAVVTSTLDEDYADEYRPREEVAADGAALTGGPYLAGAGARSCDGLAALARALAKLPGRGKLREAQGARVCDPAEAKRLRERFRDVAATTDPDALAAVETALGALLGAPASVKDDGAGPCLADALELLDLRAVR